MEHPEKCFQGGFYDPKNYEDFFFRFTKKIYNLDRLSKSRKDTWT